MCGWCGKGIGGIPGKCWDLEMLPMSPSHQISHSPFLPHPSLLLRVNIARGKTCVASYFKLPFNPSVVKVANFAGTLRMIPALAARQAKFDHQTCFHHSSCKFPQICKTEMDKSEEKIAL